MTTASPDWLSTSFEGTRGAIFGLALKTGLWTVLTLGLYRFWARTRLRRYYWSAVMPGGQPLEYSGTGAEKLAGFLLAVTILAFWLGLANLLLMFGALSLLAEPLVAYAASFAGLAPLWFFARYRARVYVLARTRWRAIRFGMAPGAIGYALRATFHWFITLLSLGVLWPRMTWRLEAYLTEKTYFGTVRLHQGGHWRDLWPGFAHAWVSGVLTVCAIAVAVFDTPRFAYALWGLVPWFAYGVVRYRVDAFRILTMTKEAPGLRLNADYAPAVVARITFFGGLALALILLAPLALIGIAGWALTSLGIEDLMQFGNLDPQTKVFGTIAAGVLVAAYFTLFLLWSALRHAFVTLPLWQHYAETTTIVGAAALGAVGQRPQAKAGEAGGFAEALDLGAAI